MQDILMKVTKAGVTESTQQKIEKGRLYINNKTVGGNPDRKKFKKKKK